MKTVFAPHLGRTVKLGRKRPIARCPRLQLRNYARLSLPTPPTSCDYGPAAKSVLDHVYLNDQLGDCVIAGGYHVVGVETGNAGALFTATDAQIIKDYSAIGGYVPGVDSTDQGCDEQTALNYWLQHGFADGTKLAGWLAVDATNKQEVMAAMYLFENLFFGIELPDAWVNPFPAGPGFTWGVAGPPDPSNGHCIMGTGYDASGVLVDTWGLIGHMTWDAVAKYCSTAGQGELYVMLTPDQLTKGQQKAPNGVSWTNLIADFDAMGGSVPLPAPPPAPPPAPVPPAPTPNPPTPVAAPTLAQVQAWAVQKLITGAPVMTRAQAEKSVIASLAAHWPKVP